MSELFHRDDPGKYLRTRIVAAAIVMLLVMGILVAKLWKLQMLEMESYAELSKKNRLRVIRLLPSRGRILDAHGVVLADNKPSFTFSVVPGELGSPEKIIRSYSSILELNPETMRRLMIGSESSPRFIPYTIKKNVSFEQVSLIKAAAPEPKGVLIEVTPTRVYPFGDDLCHVLGTIGEISPVELGERSRQGYGSGDLIGKSGIEEEFENYLKGVEGWEQVEIDARGRQLTTLARQEPRRGSDITLTIDASMQSFVEQAFIYRAGAVVVVDPDTGRILALVSKPGFDLNLFAPTISRRYWDSLKSDPLHPLENRAIRGLYSPASAFKVVTAAAALAHKVVTPSETLVCTGQIELGGQIFRCWNQFGHGRISFHRAIVESCDSYFYQIGLRLGPTRLAQYGSLFGFGKPTGVDLPQELPGLMPTKAWKFRTHGQGWTDGETLTLSIGQGYLLCTPIQLAMATAALANGGKMLKPAIVRQIRDSDGNAIYEHTPVIRWDLPFDSADLALLQRAVKGVVSEEKGTGKRAEVPGIQVAGKTGTSQVIRLREKTEADELVPYHERTHSIFVAYVDHMPKKISIAVIVEHGGPGGKAAALLAKSIVRRYYGLPDEADVKE